MAMAREYQAEVTCVINREDQKVEFGVADLRLVEAVQLVVAVAASLDTAVRLRDA
jgi:hypothetical protein